MYPLLWDLNAVFEYNVSHTVSDDNVSVLCLELPQVAKKSINPGLR